MIEYIVNFDRKMRLMKLYPSTEIGMGIGISSWELEELTTPGMKTMTVKQYVDYHTSKPWNVMITTLAGRQRGACNMTVASILEELRVGK